MAAIENIEACVFDAYGTIFDVTAAAQRCRDELGDKAAPLAALWRQKQLEYTWLRSLMGRFVDFWQITGDALDYSLDSLGIANPALRARLMDVYMVLDAYPEVPATLARLKAAGMRTAILSNGSRAMLDAAVGNAGIAGHLDAVLSVDELGVFKPHPRVYQLAVDRLGLSGAKAVCFLSSNAWDAAGAATFGFRVTWINRFGQARERLDEGPEQEIRTLDQLPPLLGL